jgi:hypothetical protein
MVRVMARVIVRTRVRVMTSAKAAKMREHARVHHKYRPRSRCPIDDHHRHRRLRHL